MIVAIVGVGLLGGSLGMAIRQQGFAERVVGIGRNPATLQRAIELGAIDEASTEFETGVGDADLIILATPVIQILRDLRRIVPFLKEGAIVTDVGSTKGQIVRTASESLPVGAFVGSHPMAGSEKSGVEAARVDLFQGATWVITPTDTTPETSIAPIEALAQAVGAKSLRIGADAHDRTVAITSHLPHVLAYALAAQAGEAAAAQPNLYDLAAGSFASMTRVAGSDPQLWLEIAQTNRYALLDAVRSYRSELQRVQLALETGDTEALLACFQSGYAANAARQAKTPE